MSVSSSSRVAVMMQRGRMVLYYTSVVVKKQKQQRNVCLMHSLSLSTLLPLESAVVQFLSCTFVPLVQRKRSGAEPEPLWSVSLHTLRDANQQPCGASSETPDQILLYLFFFPRAFFFLNLFLLSFLPEAFTWQLQVSSHSTLLHTKNHLIYY